MLVSLLELIEANSGLKIINYFSLVYKLQILLTGENGLALAINFHLISKSSFFFCQLQYVRAYIYRELERCSTSENRDQHSNHPQHSKKAITQQSSPEGGGEVLRK